MKYLLSLLLLVGPAVLSADPGKHDHGAWANKSPDELLKEAADLETAVRNQPGDIELYIRLGFVYSRLERADDAQRAFENAVRLNPKRPIAQYMLGLIYEKKGMMDQARAAWQACLDNAAEEHLRETARKHLHYLQDFRGGQ